MSKTSVYCENATLFHIAVFFFYYIAVNDNKARSIYRKPSDLKLSMVFYNCLCFLLTSVTIAFSKKTFELKSFSIGQLNTEQKWLIFKKPKMFDMYIGLLYR